LFYFFTSFTSLKLTFLTYLTVTGVYYFYSTNSFYFIADSFIIGYSSGGESESSFISTKSTTLLGLVF